MKITQKLPLSLGLACALMLSSCSKEDVATPQPMNESANEHSGLKTDAEVQLPYIAPTMGVTGLDMPTDWTKTSPAYYLLAGTSTLKALWGNPLKPWKKPLPAIPTNVSANCAITTKSYTGIASEVLEMSKATTIIKNLKPGKTYALTFYVATTTIDENVGGWFPVCAKSAEILIKPYKNGNSVKTSVDLVGKEGQWIKKTIIFSTDKDSAFFVFSGLAPEGAGYSYTHLFIDRNSIKELTAFQPMVTQPMGL